MARADITRKQKEILKELEELSKKLGYKVSYGKLRFGGLRLRGGQCLFKGDVWLVMDRAQPFEDRLEVFRNALEGADLEGQEISDGLRRLLDLPRASSPVGEN